MELAELTGVLFLLFLAYWRRDTFLYLVCGFTGIVLGLAWYDFYNTPLGLVVALTYGALGGYLIIMAIMNIWDKWAK